MAALNRTNINVQLLAIEAAMTRKKEQVYQAAMLDPLTGAELSIDDIVGLCDDLFEAHGSMMPEFVWKGTGPGRDPPVPRRIHCATTKKGVD